MVTSLKLFEFNSQMSNFDASCIYNVDSTLQISTTLEAICSPLFPNDFFFLVCLDPLKNSPV